LGQYCYFVDKFKVHVQSESTEYVWLEKLICACTVQYANTADNEIYIVKLKEYK